MLDIESVNFGEILQRLRKGKRLSQEELAFNCGLERAYISLLERNLNRPGLITFIKIAFSLGMMPSELMKEIEESEGLLENFHKWNEKEDD